MTGVCEFCRKPYFKRNAEQKYCCKDCQNKARKGIPTVRHEQKRIKCRIVILREPVVKREFKVNAGMIYEAFRLESLNGKGYGYQIPIDGTRYGLYVRPMECVEVRG